MLHVISDNQKSISYADNEWRAHISESSCVATLKDVWAIELALASLADYLSITVYVGATINAKPISDTILWVEWWSKYGSNIVRWIKPQWYRKPKWHRDIRSVKLYITEQIRL